MRKTSPLISVLVSGAMALLPSGYAAEAPVPDNSKDKDVIEYRQHIMQSINEQAAILGQMAAYAVPHDNLVAHLDAIALLASTSLKSFEPKVEGGGSRPEVWSQWSEFEKRMRTFADKTRDAAKTAQTASPDAALSNMLDVLDCKSCHDAYRNEWE